ncbi:hypothetical protein [Erythrobacter oryzae]|uniref:hypothetical protein n=1 Tax=Erythrobacter oryzae TaxID=3019556 RepID=UPI00255670B8|nr:hypothetical protein [Erythrobacter sp. COR-2]
MNRFLVSAGLALALAACGGGDSGGSPPATGGGGTPTPTPSPTPTPTYSLFSALTGDQQFRSACAGTTEQAGQISLFSDVGFIRSSTFPLAIDHDFLSATSSWRIASRSPDGFDYTYTFTPADIISTTQPNTVAYRQVASDGFGNRFAITQPTLGTTPAEYVRTTRVFTRPASILTNAFCVIGVPTLLTDRPSTPISYTQFFYNGTAFITDRTTAVRRQFDISTSTAELTANPTTGAVSVTVTIIGREFLSDGSLSPTSTALGTYTGQSVIDGTQQTFAAPFSRVPDGSVGGGFSGWFFGPQGREAGLAFGFRIIDGNNDIVLGGALTARR